MAVHFVVVARLAHKVMTDDDGLVVTLGGCRSLVQA